jgi:hypothetical protein
MWLTSQRHNVANASPIKLTTPEQFFLRPTLPRHRQYEALRAFFVERRPSSQAARDFGYSAGAFRVLCHAFRRAVEPAFFLSTRPGPRLQPKKSPARPLIVALRKQNHSIYEISESLKTQNLRLSPTAVREVLKAEGFAALPRRLDEERPLRPGPTVEPVADVRNFALESRRFFTRCGGLFLFLPDLAALRVDTLAEAARLPGSQMIPAAHALRSALALKLHSIERKSHIMALVADEGLALFAGLNAIPKRSYLSEYSCRITPRQTQRLLAAWHDRALGSKLWDGASFNLDFHSVPYYGKSPLVEEHYVSMRSRRQPSLLVFLAQDEKSQSFCYSNADLRKGEEPDEIFRFISFWKKAHGQLPRHLVFDSKLTTHANLAKLDSMKIDFITLRRRSPALLKDIYALPRSAWRQVELDVPTRLYRTPRIFEQRVRLAGRQFRQVFILDLGHEEPTILLTNQHQAAVESLIVRYAHRMLIENTLSDAVRFFHMNALSSAVGMKVDFDMALLVIASGLYRLLARRMRGYADAQARQIFRDLLDMPAQVEITPRDVRVEFHRRAHLPIVLDSELCQRSFDIPWWQGRRLQLTTYTGK